jgi:hypothetical protein
MAPGFEPRSESPDQGTGTADLVCGLCELGYSALPMALSR